MLPVLRVPYATLPIYYTPKLVSLTIQAPVISATTEWSLLGQRYILTYLYLEVHGSWVVRSRVICRVTILITHMRGLITPFIT